MAVSSRAWIMAIRYRRDDQALDAAEEQFRSLRSGDYQNQIRDIFTLLGHFDVGLVYEGQHDKEAHAFVTFLRKLVETNVQNTLTYLAVDIDKRDYPSRREGDPPAYLVGIQMTPSAPDNLITQLRAIPEVKLADVVWGDLDILALLKGNDGKSRKYRAVLAEIANTPGVARVVTMPEVV